MSVSVWSADDVAVDCRLPLAEGPLWDMSASRLLWVSILDGDVHSWDPVTHAHRTWEVGQLVGAVAPTESGPLLLAIQDGFAMLDPLTGTLELVAEVERDRPDQRMNDGKCDPRGRFWAGTMSAGDPVAGSGTLYRFTSDGGVSAMFGGVTISNGLGWSPDGSTMYYVDTPTRRISAFPFDLESGDIGSPRVLVDIPKHLGFPDGLCMDDEGCIWLALWGPGLVHRYDPDGRHIGTVKVAVPAVSSCAFGGAGLSTLFITTARLSLTPEQLEHFPHSGGVFAVDVGVKGGIVPAFRG